jgi:hypothetical protein
MLNSTETAEFHDVGGALYLCHQDDHYCLRAASDAQGVTPEETAMLKFGTGQITVPDDQQDAPIVRIAATLTEAERAAILAEGEAETTEEE